MAENHGASLIGLVSAIVAFSALSASAQEATGGLPAGSSIRLAVRSQAQPILGRTVSEWRPPRSGPRDLRREWSYSHDIAVGDHST